MSDAIRYALDHHPEPHMVVRLDGTVALANAALVALLGDVAREAIGRSWARLVRVAEQSAADDDAPPAAGSHQLQDEAGASVACDFTVLPWVWEGEPASLVVVRDARADAEVREALRQSEASFRQMAENVPGALFRYELRPDGTDAVRYMSPRCYDLWELEAASVEADASQLWAMVVEEDRAAMFASVQRSAATLTPWFWEWRIVTPSGRQKWLQGSGRPSRLEDGTVLWNTFILDVTERHQQEQAQQRLRAELRQAQQLEALGRLAGGIAHDFNNILTVILGYGEAALALAERGTTMAEFLEELLDGGRRSADLTRQLLSFARRQPSKPLPVAVPERLRGSVGLLQRLIGESVRLEYDLAGDCPPVLIDPVQLDQVVTNLVLNARDAMPEGGTVRIVVRAETGPETSLRGVALTVNDTGHGMDAETQARIFEPFFSTKGEGKGTGLGLATVYGIVQAAQGRLTVESAPGRGTAFTVWLPAATAATVGGTEPAQGAPVMLPAGTVVLVVEDDPHLRRFTVTVLRDAGCAVLEAADGPSALGVARGPGAADLRLVVSDVVLPGMSGPELARRLTAERPGVAVLFTTGYVADERVRQQLEATGAPLLPKPFGADALRAAAAGALVGARR